MTKSLLIATAAGISGLAVGGLVGYKVAEKRLASQFDERLEKETAEMRVFYTTVKKPYSTPEEAVKDLIPEPVNNVLVEYKGEAERVAYHKVVPSEETPKPEDFESFEGTEEAQEVHQNIFTSPPDHPYLITEEEFNQNETEFAQVSLVYYQKDDILTDTREDVIEDVEKTVGTVFKSNFGYGGADDNYVHVRNKKLRIDFEIVRNDGSYAEEVLGLDATPIERPSARQRGE